MGKKLNFHSATPKTNNKRTTHAPDSNIGPALHVP